MSKKISLLSLILLIVTSCNTITETEKSNLNNLTKLKVGMAKSEVQAIMGKPLKNEVYHKDDVWYYFTGSKWSDGMITNDECTPVFFKNNELLGWGHKKYKIYTHKDW